MNKWQCSICKYIHTGDTPPAKCPVCGVSSDKFVLLKTESESSTASQFPPKSPEPTPATEPTPAAAPTTLYEKTVELILKHHAHPVFVHTPNGILPVVVILYILAWIFDSDLLVKAGFINLIFVILSLPFVLFSGVIEWQNKYHQTLTTIFKIKIIAASLTVAASLISLGWYLIDPLVLSSSKALLFIFINIVMLASAGIAGFIGGKLVFKD
ncbi:MAG: rubredoxin [Desulfobacteraceae bacterium]|nr:rubredoxin [Desulfobacteraceae bacterium]